MKLQHQMSNGSWVDCGTRTEEFLGRCEEFSSQDREGVLADLAAGKKVRNDRSDWYSVCRDGEVHEAAVAAPVTMKKCSCGHTVPQNLVMSGSLGSCCLKCYEDVV
jgi:hypothetical protein